MKRNTIYVQNLKCGGCANTLTRGIGSLDRIENVTVDAEASSISFDYQDETQVDEVKQKLKSLGYPAVDEDNSFGDKAKSYVSCMIGRVS